MNTTLETIVKLTPIGISILALCVSAFSIGWNIYRDVVLKARLKVKFSLCEIHHPTFAKPITTLSLAATNFGPGQIRCAMIQLLTAPLWRRIIRRPKRAVMLHDYSNPLSGKLPARLEVGETIDLLIPYDKDCFLREKHTHIGLSDSFGRVHWAPTKDVIKARREFRKDFGKKRPAANKAIEAIGGPRPPQPHG